MCRGCCTGACGPRVDRARRQVGRGRAACGLAVRLPHLVVADEPIVVGAVVGNHRLEEREECVRQIRLRIQRASLSIALRFELVVTRIHRAGRGLTYSRGQVKVERVEMLHGMLPAMASPRRHGTATAADLVDMEHHEVVGGELVEKTAPSGEHGTVQYGLGGLLFGFHGPGGGESPGGWWLGTEIEVELEAHEVYLPDIAGWRIERMPEPPRGRPVRVVPDWVCEVLSPSTAARDLGWKLHAYHRARVGHYWVVDPANQALTVYRWQEGGYVPVLAAGADDVVRAEPFDAPDLDIGFDIGRIFGRPPKHSKAE